MDEHTKRPLFHAEFFLIGGAPTDSLNSVNFATAFLAHQCHQVAINTDECEISQGHRFSVACQLSRRSVEGSRCGCLPKFSNSVKFADTMYGSR